METRHLSQTFITDYLDCEAYANYAHIIKLPKPRTIQMLAGQAWGEALQASIARKKPMSGEFAAQYFWSIANAEPNKAWTHHDEADMVKDIKRVGDDPKVHAFIDSLKDAKSIECEAKREVSILGTTLMGYFDMLIDGVVYEFKLRWKRQPPKPLDIQIVHYAVLANKGNFTPVKLRKVEFIIHAKEIIIEDNTHEVSPQAQKTYFHTLLTPLVRSVQLEVFKPNPNSWRCGADKCPFWKYCLGKEGDNADVSVRA